MSRTPGFRGCFWVPQHLGSGNLKLGEELERESQSKEKGRPLDQELPPMILCQLQSFVEVRRPVALDPLCHSCWELSDEVFQYKQLNDLFRVVLLCHQPPVTGVSQMLHIGEESADLGSTGNAPRAFGQYAAVPPSLCWNAAAVSVLAAAGWPAGLCPKAMGGVAELSPPPGVSTQQPHTRTAPGSFWIICGGHLHERNI